MKKTVLIISLIFTLFACKDDPPLVITTPPEPTKPATFYYEYYAIGESVYWDFMYDNLEYSNQINLSFDKLKEYAQKLCVISVYFGSNSGATEEDIEDFLNSIWNLSLFNDKTYIDKPKDYLIARGNDIFYFSYPIPSARYWVYVEKE